MNISDHILLSSAQNVNNNNHKTSTPIKSTSKKTLKNNHMHMNIINLKLNIQITNNSLVKNFLHQTDIKNVLTIAKTYEKSISENEAHRP